MVTLSPQVPVSSTLESPSPPTSPGLSTSPSITAKQLTGRLHRCFRDAPPYLCHCIYQTTMHSPQTGLLWHYLGSPSNQRQEQARGYPEICCMVVLSQRTGYNLSAQSSTKNPSSSPPIPSEFQLFSVISHWNTLPEDIVDAPSINSFKSRLNRFYTLLS